MTGMDRRLKEKYVVYSCRGCRDKEEKYLWRRTREIEGRQTPEW